MRNDKTHMFVIFPSRYDKDLQESTKVLPITHTECCEEETWHDHPTLPIKINSNGNHLFDMSTRSFIPITVITYKLRSPKSNVPLIKVIVSCCGGTQIFYRVALECFWKQVLTNREHVDHVNRDRTDNTFENLRAVSALESANNKSTTEKYRKDESMSCVYHRTWTILDGPILGL